jgi:hypothetical protein
VKGRLAPLLFCGTFNIEGYLQTGKFMAQINRRSKDAATYVGFETTFGSTPATMVRAFPVEGTFNGDIMQTELENLEEMVDLYDNKATVRGLKGGTVKADFYMRVPSLQLVSGQSSQTHYLNEVLRGGLGFRLVSQGSLVAGVPTQNVIDVTTPQGTRFSRGSWCGVEVDGEIEPAKVIDRTGDTLTLFPDLSAIPTAGALVVNSYTYLPSVNSAASLHIQHAINGDSSEGLQWAMSGSAVSLTFDIKRNELAKITMEATVADWQGPGNFGFVTASASDPMSTPFAVRDAITIFQPVTTTTRDSYCLISAEVKLNGGLEHVECLGAIEGKTSVFRKSQRLFVEATLKFRFDNVMDSLYWQTQELMSCIMMIPKGSGTTKRWIVLEIPTCRIVGKPKLTDENGMQYMEVTVHGTRDETVVNALSTNLESAPFRVALI